MIRILYLFLVATSTASLHSSFFKTPNGTITSERSLFSQDGSVQVIFQKKAIDALNVTTGKRIFRSTLLTKAKLITIAGIAPHNTSLHIFFGDQSYQGGKINTQNILVSRWQKTLGHYNTLIFEKDSDTFFAYNNELPCQESFLFTGTEEFELTDILGHRARGTTLQAIEIQHSTPDYTDLIFLLAGYQSTLPCRVRCYRSEQKTGKTAIRIRFEIAHEESLEAAPAAIAIEPEKPQPEPATSTKNEYLTVLPTLEPQPEPETMIHAKISEV